ncbi:MAG: ABC transporter ATP-binding protein [Clostridiaceae bacterium]|jgi:oligopeptide/dipeptide ABC transporter ATP-binding protein|nr:ABC transporter ATP-binding protein [Bacillota bacterium]NLN51944.1 ABC transporter ATP-binding protein [Clostridiaceae bacterium]
MNKLELTNQANPEYTLKVEHLKVVSTQGAELVRDVSLAIKPGEIVGLVGESGSGKSITTMAIVGILPDGISIAKGKILFQGQDITRISADERCGINGNKLGIIYQDASQALNPLMRIGKQIDEVLKIHTDLSLSERQDRVLGTMRAVNLPDVKNLAKRYPHELSGGQRQRVLIAMAIINNPQLLIADEPTTALDVTVTAQILDLIKIINESKQISVLYISHDFSTVNKLCDRVFVLYAGIPVEIGSVKQVIENPQHPYTELLLESIPTKEKRGQKLLRMKGRTQDPRGPALNCQFADRCPKAFGRCRQELPPMYQVTPGHTAACFLLNNKGE